MHFFGCVYWCLLLVNLDFYQTANLCAYFTLNKYPVVIKDSVATLSFTVNNACNSAMGNVKIILKNDSPPHPLLCNIKFANGVCSDLTGCTYNQQTHEYTVSRRIAGGKVQPEVLELSGELQNGEQFQKMVHLNTTYSPVILGMDVESKGKPVEGDGLVEWNTAIQITCLWSEGIPFRDAVMKKDGVVLTTSEIPSTDRTRHGLHHSAYIIRTAGCLDSGRYTCEAAGASESKSSELLVRCSPQFDDILTREFTFESSETLLQFPVHMHKNEIVECRLRRFARLLIHTEVIDCGSMMSWSGQIPQLTLTIRLTRVTPQLAGEWRLELENRIGTGTVTFSLVFKGSTIAPAILKTADINPKEATTTNVRESDNLSGANFQFLVLGAIGFIFLLMIILATVFGILYKRRAVREGRQLSLPPPAPHGLRRRMPADAILQGVLRTAAQKDGSTETFVSAHGHIYSDIDDNTAPKTTTQNEVSLETSSLSDSFGPNDNLTTIAIASSDSTVSDGYLHPVTGSQLEGSVSEVTHHHAAPPSASGVAASDDPVTRSSQNVSASENVLLPVASKTKKVTDTTKTAGVTHPLAAPPTPKDDAASDNPVAKSSQNISESENYLHPMASKTKKVTGTTTTCRINHPLAARSSKDGSTSNDALASSQQPFFHQL